MKKKVKTTHRVDLKGCVVQGRGGLYYIRIEVVRPFVIVNRGDTDKREFNTVEEAVKELFALIGDKWKFGGIEATFYQDVDIDIPTVKT